MRLRKYLRKRGKQIDDRLNFAWQCAVDRDPDYNSVISLNELLLERVAVANRNSNEQLQEINIPYQKFSTNPAESICLKSRALQRLGYTQCFRTFFPGPLVKSTSLGEGKDKN